jgi:branched-subunit amino acid aminotransferase/4-amino-4-deoxychorismate lyase
MSDRTVYFNGELVPADQASISIADPAFLHGASTFTTMYARNGVIFRFAKHLERLAETIRFLGMAVEATTGELVEATYRTLDANALTEARCRITLTPGPPDGRPTTLIITDPLPEYPTEWYTRGVGVIVTALKQQTADPTFGHKTGCYLPRMLARREAAAKGCDDALWFTPDGRLAEACFSNVFLVQDGKVFTPPRDTPVLPGVVRDAVIELCTQLDIPCDDETPLTVEEMLAAEEMFLSSSCMGIRPVARVERHAYGDETPGPVTRRIIESYRELLDRECSKRT